MNDTYSYTSGNDIYVDGSGTDSIVLPSAYTQANTVYYTIGNDLKIVFGTDNLNSILISGFYGSGGAIETLDFYTGTDATLTSVSTITQGDNNNNTLNGTANDDTLYGFAGNDTINGNNGPRDLRGSAGRNCVDVPAGRSHAKESFPHFIRRCAANDNHDSFAWQMAA